MRVSKILSQYGICSRREAERMIDRGLIKVNGIVISAPYTRINDTDDVTIKGVALHDAASLISAESMYSNRQQIVFKKSYRNHAASERPSSKTSQAPQARLWLYNKPKQTMVTYSDPQNRTTIFSLLPTTMPRVISVGRLDYNSEGLLLLTNNGPLARALELPANEIKRTYLCRHDAKIPKIAIDMMKNGVTIDGISYRGMHISYEKNKKDIKQRNLWCQVTISEGKNREIRKIFKHFGANVSRLIRVQYGPFKLQNLQPNDVIEISDSEILSFTQTLQHK